MADFEPAEPPHESHVDAGVAWPRVTGKAISDYLGFTAPWLRKLEQAGFVDRGPDGLFDAGDVCRGYIRWLKDDARRNSKSESTKRKEEEQIRKLQIENAKALNELVDMETVDLAFSEMFTMLANEIRVIPAAVTRDVSLRAQIETVINSAFARCRDGFEKLKKEVPSGRSGIGVEETDDE